MGTSVFDTSPIFLQLDYRIEAQNPYALEPVEALLLAHQGIFECAPPHHNIRRNFVLRRLPEGLFARIYDMSGLQKERSRAGTCVDKSNARARCCRNKTLCLMIFSSNPQTRCPMYSALPRKRFVNADIVEALREARCY